MTTDNQVDEPKQDAHENAHEDTPAAPSQYQEFQNNYINRIKKPQKGYRRMMASMY